MSWSISVKGFPEVNEPIVSMSSCMGNLATATEIVGFPKLPHIEKKTECIAAILKVIEEVDKENLGLFNDDWCVECDLAWSNGREMKDEWERWELILDKVRMPFKDEKSCWGHMFRRQLRESAIRFYLYYKSGYKITYTW